jgi:PhnB protein
MATRISTMLAVPDAQAAAAWYERALGAQRVRDLGSVLVLAVDGAPFLLHEPTAGFAAPDGAVTARVELFSDTPDALVASAVAAGADGAGREPQDHEMPWGTHHQGGFVDPFGHVWLVGDHSPLAS